MGGRDSTRRSLDSCIITLEHNAKLEKQDERHISEGLRMLCADETSERGGTLYRNRRARRICSEVETKDALLLIPLFMSCEVTYLSKISKARMQEIWEKRGFKMSMQVSQGILGILSTKSYDNIRPCAKLISDLQTRVSAGPTDTCYIPAPTLCVPFSHIIKFFNMCGTDRDETVFSLPASPTQLPTITIKFDSHADRTVMMTLSQQLATEIINFLVAGH